MSYGSYVIFLEVSRFSGHLRVYQIQTLSSCCFFTVVLTLVVTSGVVHDRPVDEGVVDDDNCESDFRNTKLIKIISFLFRHKLGLLRSVLK